MIKILLVEDHKIVRNGIKLILEADPQLEVVQEAKDGQQALKFLDEGLEIDIVLADIQMPEMGGIDLIGEIKLRFPEIKIIVLSMFENQKYVSQAFSKGASAYLIKNVDAAELIFCIKQVHAGQQYICAEISFKLLDHFTLHGAINFEPGNAIVLSSREIEVLNCIAEGYTNMEIADKIFLSKRTIEGHRQSLLEKTKSKNTAALIRYAVMNGLLS
ncbi:response regulator [Pedobacter sp. PWIIR3]